MKVTTPAQLLDLSHDIYDGMLTYKGLPAPIICDYLSRENSRAIYGKDTEFHIASINMVGNTGTYIDCPFHRFENGEDFADLGLSSFADLAAVKIDVQGENSIEISHFDGVNLTGKAVLLHTGWAKHWGQETYFENHPYLTATAATYLKAKKVKLVGIDSHNIDDTRQHIRPAHTTLLGSGILIVEHMTNLEQLPESGFFFSAVPPKLKGVGTFPVRAFARIEK